MPSNMRAATFKGAGSCSLERRASKDEPDLMDDSVVQELRALDDEYLALEKQLKNECDELASQYAGRYAQVLKLRQQRLYSATPAIAVATPAVPGFWKTVLQNAAEFQEDIEEYDEPVLDFLRDISHELIGAGGEDGFMLRFTFEANPYFSNTELVKIYHTERKNPFAQRLECIRIEAPHIDWRVGKNVTVQIVTRKAKGGGKKRLSKSQRAEEPRPSFFRVFFRNLGPDEPVPDEELEDLEVEEENLGDIMDLLIQSDYEQALALREHIAPRAVRWYTGEACDLDDDDDEEEEEEEENGHEDEEESCDVNGVPDASVTGGNVLHSSSENVGVASVAVLVRVCACQTQVSVPCHGWRMN